MEGYGFTKLWIATEKGGCESCQLGVGKTGFFEG
jgi:hypothetical protein